MGIAKADKKRKKALKILLFGDGGVGKTHLALKATPGKTLIFDAESGADLFEGREGFKFDYWLDDDGLKTSSIKELKKVMAILKTEEGREQYETFIIDPISDIWDNIQAQRSEYKDVVNSKKAFGKQKVAINETDLESFNQKDWGDMKRVYKDIMLDLKNLPQNIFLLAREKEISETKPDGTIIKTGEYTFDGEKNTKYAVDFVIRLSYDEKSDKRRAHIMKSRAEGLEKGVVIENPTFEMFNKVVNLMAEGKPTTTLSKKSENIFEEETKSDSEVDKVRAELIAKAKSLGGQSNEVVATALKKYGNPNGIKDINILKEYLNELSIEPVKEETE